MNLAQSAFTCSKLTIEILEQGAKQICVGVGLHKTFFLDLKIKFDYKKTDWWISEGSCSFFCENNSDLWCQTLSVFQQTFAKVL